MSIGVALAGGGLKGMAYIGALKALDELGVKIEYLSGTSSGSIFATAFAMGFDFDEIHDLSVKNYKLLTNISKRPIFKAGVTYVTSKVARIEGLMDGANISNMIEKFAEKKNIYNMNEIEIPFAIATVDTISTKECLFLSKKYDFKNTENVDYLYDTPISTAVRASMSFPGVFTPCPYEKYNFIDGGTKDNLPVHILKKMGADKTIALSFKIDEYEPKEDIFAVLLRAVDIFSLKDVRKAQKEADLAIEIDCAGTSLLEIKDTEQVVKVGYDTVMSHKKEILELIKK